MRSTSLLIGFNSIFVTWSATVCVPHLHVYSDWTALDSFGHVQIFAFIWCHTTESEKLIRRTHMRLRGGVRAQKIPCVRCSMCHCVAFCHLFCI